MTAPTRDFAFMMHFGLFFFMFCLIAAAAEICMVRTHCIVPPHDGVCPTRAQKCFVFLCFHPFASFALFCSPTTRPLCFPCRIISLFPLAVPQGFYAEPPRCEDGTYGVIWWTIFVRRVYGACTALFDGHLASSASWFQYPGFVVLRSPCSDSLRPLLPSPNNTVRVPLVEKGLRFRIWQYDCRQYDCR